MSLTLDGESFTSLDDAIMEWGRRVKATNESIKREEARLNARYAEVEMRERACAIQEKRNEGYLRIPSEVGAEISNHIRGKHPKMVVVDTDGDSVVVSVVYGKTPVTDEEKHYGRG